MRLGIDLMGSEGSPEQIMQAVSVVSQSTDNAQLVVIGTPKVLSQLSSYKTPNLFFHESGDAIEMDEPPLLAIRRKKEASMNIGIRLLKEKKLDAFLSTGNTGALMASSLIQLGQLPGVERPGLLVHLPNHQQGVVCLDVGANLNPKPEHLLAYGKMAVAFRKYVHGMQAPRVGLLNIGTEQQKGTQGLKESYVLFQKFFGKSFVGNVEGKEVFSGNVDVLVTDGFTGNVFLKTCEGITSFLTDYLNTAFSQMDEKGSLSKVAQHLHQRFDYSQHPGAFLAGVQGVVVKCHGYSNQVSLVNGIKGALDLIQCSVLEKMRVCFADK